MTVEQWHGMRLATVRTSTGTSAIRLEETVAKILPADDVGDVLNRPGWRDWAATAEVGELPLTGLDFAPVVPKPGKILAVGLNYRDHIGETGAAMPAHPALFPKYGSTLIGAYDDIVVSAERTRMDWEAELAVVVGAPLRNASVHEAEKAIAGYSVLNDCTDRELQYRTSQWTQGKIVDGTCPFGPYLLVTDDPRPQLSIECEIDDEVKQRSNTEELVFAPAELLSYISHICALDPGDVIATGTPGGVGNFRTPAEFLSPGNRLVTRISSLGECRNTFENPSAKK